MSSWATAFSSGTSRSPTEKASNLTINVTDGTLIPTGERSILSAWNIAFFGAIVLLIVLPIISPKPFLDILAFVPDGLIATFGVTLA